MISCLDETFNLYTSKHKFCKLDIVKVWNRYKIFQKYERQESIVLFSTRLSRKLLPFLSSIVDLNGSFTRYILVSFAKNKWKFFQNWVCSQLIFVKWELFASVWFE